MRERQRFVLLAALALTLGALAASGCSATKTGGTPIPMESFGVTASLDGAIALPATTLPDLQLPAGSGQVAQLGALAFRLLVKTQPKLGVCTVDPAVTTAQGATVVLTFAAHCTAGGTPIEETGTVVLTPKGGGAAAGS